MDDVFSCVAAAKWQCRSTACRRVTWWCVEGYFGTLSQVDRLCARPQQVGTEISWWDDRLSRITSTVGLEQDLCVQQLFVCHGPDTHPDPRGADMLRLMAGERWHLCVCVFPVRLFVWGCVPSVHRVIAGIYMVLIVYWALCAFKASLNWTVLRDIRC